jgi:ADP-ribose pyrophosphatase YjhB (NUDIX family)
MVLNKLRNITQPDTGVHIRRLESAIGNPEKGLPEEVFLFISGVTPLINVDLLIKNDKGETLLTWRDDGLCVPGWHVPGGIIRYKEKITERIVAVAKNELGAKIEYENEPLKITEIIHPTRKVRGHFISMLYECVLIGTLSVKLKFNKKTPKQGQWAWHSKCPDNIIAFHEVYRKYIDNKGKEKMP